MSVFKEINKADGSGVTQFFRLSSEKQTVETHDYGDFYNFKGSVASESDLPTTKLEVGDAYFIEDEEKTVFWDGVQWLKIDAHVLNYNYNDASNKPLINGHILQGDKTAADLELQPAGNYLTEIPSEYVTEGELEDYNYATKAYVIEQVNNAEHFHREIVTGLPVIGKDNVIYMIKKVDAGEDDIYDEYMWVNTKYEHMGSTATDLTNYYKKGEVDSLLEGKVSTRNGFDLSSNDYTTAEKTKLASLENYDDSELRGKVNSLHNYDDTAIRLDIQDLKKDVSTKEIDIASIENELGYKAEVIRLVKSGDWWLCQDAKGNNLTLEMAMNKLGLSKTILLLENLENDGKYYPVEYKLQDKYIDIVYKDLDGVTHHLNYGYNEYFTNTASGDYIHLEDCINYPYKELEVDGVCEQETRSGKNLFTLGVENTTGIGVTTLFNDSEITLNNSTSNEGNIFQKRDSVVKDGYRYIGTFKAETYTYQSLLKSGSFNIPSGKGFAIYLRDDDGNTYITIPNSFDKVQTITLPKETKLYLQMYANSGSIQFNNIVFDIQIELGSTATSYEPYTGGQLSPSLDYPQEVKTIENSLKITSTDSNIFDTTNSVWKENVGTSLVGQEQRNSMTINGRNGWGNIGYMFRNVRKNTNMVLSADFLDTVSNTPERKVGITAYESDNDNNTKTLVYISSEQETIDINSTKRIACKFNSGGQDYIYIRFWNNATANALTNLTNLTISNIKLEFGDEETAYSELHSQIEVNLPEGEFIGKINDTYKDTLKVECNEEDGQYHLVLNKNIGKVVLDGITNAFVGKSGQIGNCFTITGDDAIKGESLNIVPYLKSTHFIPVSWNDRVNYLDNAVIFRYSSATNYVFRFGENSTVTTLDLANNYLKEQYNANKPVTMYYPLATPYILDLGIVNMPITYNKITNLFTDSNLLPTINIEYYTEILENAKDTIIGRDIYLQNEVNTVNDLPAEANKGDICKVKDTKNWYIYDGVEWSPFDKGGSIDLSNYLAKDNTTGYAPTGNYNPATKKYVDDSVATIHIPTKLSQLTNDSGYILKTSNDLTHYYTKASTYTKAEVNALIAEKGGETSEWGNITGTLSNQTDLSTALYNKLDTTDIINSRGQVTSKQIETATTYPYGATFKNSVVFDTYLPKYTGSNKPTNPEDLVPYSYMTETEEWVEDELSKKIDNTDIVTIVNGSSTDDKIPSAKAVYNAINSKYAKDGETIFGWYMSCPEGGNMTELYGFTKSDLDSFKVGDYVEWPSTVMSGAVNGGMIIGNDYSHGYKPEGGRYYIRTLYVGRGSGYGFTYVYDLEGENVYKGMWPDSEGGLACFAGDTIVHTSDGDKTIDTLQVGDKVKSANVFLNIIEDKPITKIIEHEANNLVEITTKDDKIITTGDHPFNEKEKGVTPARCLEKGDKLDTGDLSGAEVKSVKTLNSVQKVYEIVVEDNHNYYVGKTHILVHNEHLKEN